MIGWDEGKAYVKNTSTYVIRQHTSAYVSIRQHTSALQSASEAYVSIGEVGGEGGQRGRRDNAEYQRSSQTSLFALLH
jgi:hypothetical protein